MPESHRSIVTPFRQWLALCLSLCIIGAIFALHIHGEYRDVARQEQVRLSTQARVIAVNMERQIQTVKVVLQGVSEKVAGARIPVIAGGLNPYLRTLDDAMPGVRTILVLDRTGKAVASSRPELVGRDFRDRDYFTAVQRNPAQDNLYVTAPFKTVLGAFVMNVSVMVSGADGGFDGVVLASLDPDYFTTLLSSVLYAPDMWCYIAHGDGRVFMLIPAREGMPGKDLAVPGTLFTRHLLGGKPQTLFAETAYVTGEKRFIVFQTVRPPSLRMDKPLVVTVSRDLDLILAGWRNGALAQLAAYLMICTGFVVGLFFLQRRQEELDSKARMAGELIRIRLRLLESAARQSIDDFLQTALDEICTITGSHVGFYHFVESDQKTLSLQAWSTRTLDEFCTARGHGAHYSIEEAGVWAECVPLRRPVIHNDYASLPNRKGLPEGHAPVVRELVVPVFREDRVLAILGVGNKPSDYDDKDVELVSYLADIAWEITERKRAENEARESRQRLSNIFEFLPDATFVVDMEKKVIAWNRAMEEMSGICKAGMIGRGDHAYTVPFYGERRNQLIDLIDLDDEELASSYENVTRAGNCLYAEAFCPALKEGQGSHIWAVVSPLFDADGKRIGAIESIRDITAQKESEAELRRFVQELQDALARIVKLEGILSICMFCKKIRADQDSWQQMERYISEHSDAVFSHGICPDCYEKVAPGYTRP